MTIKRKLVLITMATCIVALLSAGVIFVAWEWSTFRRAMAQNLSTQAEIIADNCKAAVAFEDAEDVEEILLALRAEPSTVFACVYTSESKLFAAYYRDNTDSSVQPPRPQKSCYVFNDGSLTVFKPVVLEGEPIGTVCLRSDLLPLYKAFMRNINIAIAVLLFSTLVAYFLSSRLQKIISRPILSLAEVAKGVSEKKDYSTRALKQSSDEVGLLIDAFNEMLEQIQRRDLALVTARNRLEERVKARTVDITVANEQLSREITERKKAEEEQAKLLRKIGMINSELKDFAYVVSHDLKAPLRGIGTLAEWIINDYADKLDEQGKEQMNLLSVRVNRMHNLIEGVLQYSRVGRTAEEIVRVDLNKLVSNVIDTIAPPESFTITVENKLPVIECEETRIIQIFQNLLSNAVKYMDKPQGQVKIGCVEENGFWRFSVADNGPGIEEKHFERIFQMFQTLSPRDEFESTGVGLTVAKKIVELYGGRIWLESKPGKGSTFFFTLPKQELGVRGDARFETNIVS